MEPTNRATSLSNGGDYPTLELRAEDGAFVLFDTDAADAVMHFDHCRDADQLVAELQVQELHAALERWAPERVPTVY